jgi:hypothetical protein
VAVDGGHEYVRRVFRTKDYTENCEWKLISKEDLIAKIKYYYEQSIEMSFYADNAKKGEELLKKWYS